LARLSSAGANRSVGRVRNALAPETLHAISVFVQWSQSLLLRLPTPLGAVGYSSRAAANTLSD
jgi:hypothetical protein